MYNIPILFVFFNRKDIALKAFAEVRKTKASRIYLAQDGPRRNEEAETVTDVRKAIIDAIDWQCEVHTLFREKNLGCSLGVKTAIDWLMENEEYGIVLEDDCIANNSFFRYMEDMLLNYKDDQRIGMVAGSNLIKGFKPRFSYHFSRFKSCWGWGTWRRAWTNMDMDMSWRKEHIKDVINNSGFNGEHNSKWYFQLKCIDHDYVSAWDWQWYFTLAAQNQLCIYPSVNLVTNIGNDAEATHTSFGVTAVESKELHFPLNRPVIVAPDVEFDRLFSRNENTMYYIAIRYIPHSIKIFIKKLINRIKIITYAKD